MQYLAAVRAACAKCTEEAPYKPMDPSERVQEPQYTFQIISMDFFEVCGAQYLMVEDQYYNRPLVYQTSNFHAVELMRVVMKIFSCYRVVEDVTYDGDMVFTSHQQDTRRSLRREYL